MRLIDQARGFLRETRRHGLRRKAREAFAFAAPRLTARKVRYRFRHDIAPHARPVFVLGVQRSGTSMLVRGLNASPAVEMHGEGDPAAFDDFRLRPLPVIRSLVERSGHACVIFKPLCDSHRAVELLDRLGTPTGPVIVWTYRQVDDRVRSSLALFGPHNLEVLRDVAAGIGLDRWQAQGLSSDSLDLIRSFDYTTLSPESAAALFWYVRNRMYFELGLDQRKDAALCSYDALIKTPSVVMGSVASFIGLPNDPRMASHITPRTREAQVPLELDPIIRGRCDELQSMIDGAYRLEPVT